MFVRMRIALSTTCLLVIGPAVTAGEPAAQDPRQTQTMRLGSGSPSQPFAAMDREDTLQVNHRYRYPGVSFYHGGYRSYPATSFYFGVPRYYAPHFYAPPVFYYSRPSFYVYPSPRFGCFSPIAGGIATAGVTLNLGLFAREPDTGLAPIPAATPQLPSPLSAPRGVPSDSFRYDGGPSQPIPIPAPDARSLPNPGELPIKPLDLRPRANTVNVSLPRSSSDSNPYRYRAYGEK